MLPGVSNALAARVVADLGFSAAYVTGAGIANTYLGIPDNGLVTLSELADHVSDREVLLREVERVVQSEGYLFSAAGKFSG